MVNKPSFFCKQKRNAFDVPCGAEDETRTRDPHLGKVMLYQLSHFRISLTVADSIVNIALIKYICQAFFNKKSIIG